MGKVVAKSAVYLNKLSNTDNALNRYKHGKIVAEAITLLAPLAVSKFSKLSAAEEVAVAVEKNLSTFEKELQKAVGAGESGKSAIKFVSNYNVRNSGLMAEFFDDLNKSIGKLFKNVQGDKLKYTFKYFKPDGNILKIDNQLVELRKGVLLADLNLEKVKGLGVGSTIFDDAISYFGSKIEGIGGTWEVNQAYSSGISDNLVSYRNALNVGKTANEAAFSTGTGKWALKYGYSKVEFIGEKSINSPVIEVIFKK